MLKTIPKYTSIKGCTIYRLNAAGMPLPTPAAIDVDITISEQTHPSTDVSMMGTVGVPDQSRLDNFTVTANVNCDSPEAAALSGAGIVGWFIRWVDEVIDEAGMPQVIGWDVTAKGYITGAPEATKNVGSENMGDISMNVVAITKKNSLGYVAYDIDRRVNKLVRNNIDYRSDINKLL